MNSNTIITLSSKEDSTFFASRWINMEQEAVPTSADTSSIQDLNQMMILVTTGRSAFEYVMRNCGYISILDSQIVVTIPFYVFPSSLNLPYELVADIGETTEGEVVAVPRSRDVVFNNSDSEILGWIFSGSYTKSMPFFSPTGETINNDSVTFDGGVAKTNQPGYCVYRIDGDATGFLHYSVMTFDKLDENGGINTITDINNTIFAKFEDAEGELQTSSLTLKIPGCVEAALKTCPNGYAYDVVCFNCQDPRTLNVYFNTCNGEVLDYWYAEPKSPLKIKG